MYHEPQRQQEPSGCMDALILTRVVFGILFWPLVIMLAVLGAVLLVFTLLFTDPLLGLLALLGLAAAVAAFAWWDRRRVRPPE
ncbi:MAG TPA: hypothetical protein VIO14_09560 [Dehalococcoidia bacterium]